MRSRDDGRNWWLLQIERCIFVASCRHFTEAVCSCCRTAPNIDRISSTERIKCVAREDSSNIASFYDKGECVAKADSCEALRNSLVRACRERKGWVPRSQFQEMRGLEGPRQRQTDRTSLNEETHTPASPAHTPSQRSRAVSSSV